jgi:hypothetical protein
VVRWINLGLAVVLATMLLIQLTRSREPAPAAEIVTAAPTHVVKERPSRRSHRVEMRAAIEESRRQRAERLRAPGGPIVRDGSGKPIVD